VIEMNREVAGGRPGKIRGPDRGLPYYQHTPEKRLSPRQVSTYNGI